MIAYKSLRRGAVGRYSGFRWPTPTARRAGDWVEVAGPLRLAAKGIHACRINQLPRWLDTELWELELDEPVQEAAQVLLGRRGRLLRPIDRWNDAAAGAFVRACVDRSWERAAGSLRTGGEADRADALVGTGPDPLAAAAAAEEVSEPLASVLLAAGDVAFASDAAMSPSLVAYLAATVASAAATVDGTAADAELTERHWQGRWLAERLQLT